MKFASFVVALLLLGLAAEATKVSVKNLKTGQVYKLDADVRQSVEMFKRLIQQEKGAPRALHQVLIFNGRSLDNEAVLGDFNVQEGSQLDMASCKKVAAHQEPCVWSLAARRAQGATKVFVKYLKNGITRPVDIDLKGTVRSLKRQIEFLSLDWEVDVQVLLSGKQMLDDDQTLEHYGIKNGATLDLGVCLTS